MKISFFSPGNVIKIDAARKQEVSLAPRVFVLYFASPGGFTVSECLIAEWL